MGYRENLLNAIEGDKDHPLNCGIPMQVHHLLSKQAATNSGIKTVLESYGYDINDIGNLVALPCTFAGACHLEVQLHRGNHTSSSNDDDDEHDEPYHAHATRLMIKAMELIEKNCEEGNAKKVQNCLDKKSSTILGDIKTYRIRLTRVHRYFKSGEVGCNGLGKKAGKFSIDDLVDSNDVNTHGCDRNHTEFKFFKKRKYDLEVGK
ncbi:MAG: AHH domain-containing protein [Vibrio sp.]|uniref:AHH domain-containing protein n=1 Tax=Vibrio sp. TaxID=678 RepID=UPI001EC8EDB6|nr:AHH domain-containing protein [Vibrio sp.]NRB70220.1 AHH domain-containing protein [Vibrio sp.]